MKKQAEGIVVHIIKLINNNKFLIITAMIFVSTFIGYKIWFHLNYDSYQIEFKQQIVKIYYPKEAIIEEQKENLFRYRFKKKGFKNEFVAEFGKVSDEVDCDLWSRKNDIQGVPKCVDQESDSPFFGYYKTEYIELVEYDWYEGNIFNAPHGYEIYKWGKSPVDRFEWFDRHKTEWPDNKSRILKTDFRGRRNFVQNHYLLLWYDTGSKDAKDIMNSIKVVWMDK